MAANAANTKKKTRVCGADYTNSVEIKSLWMILRQKIIHDH